jgi:hypothetical protein
MPRPRLIAAGSTLLVLAGCAPYTQLEDSRRLAPVAACEIAICPDYGRVATERECRCLGSADARWIYVR